MITVELSGKRTVDVLLVEGAARWYLANHKYSDLSRADYRVIDRACAAEVDRRRRAWCARLAERRARVVDANA